MQTRNKAQKMWNEDSVSHQLQYQFEANSTK